MPKLTPKIIKQLAAKEAAYYITDTVIPGLQLRTAPDGSKGWSVRYRIGKRQRRLTLGTLAVLDLPEARKAAKDALKLVQKDIDPAAKKAERRTAETVGETVEDYLTWAESHKRSWKDDKRRLTTHVLPEWKHRPIAGITRGDIRTLLASIEAPIESNRTHSVISKLLSYALDEEIITAHPMVRMKKAHSEQSRDRVLTHDEVRQFWTATDALDAPMSAYYRLRLVTAQRGHEVATMKWTDIDLLTGWWTIPSTVAKNKLAHRVPLSSTALDIIKALRTTVDAELQVKRDAGKDATEPTFVLENARGKRQQAEAAATFSITDFRGHDLRRTAASMMAGSGTPRLVISKILNHVESGITRVYDRHSYDAEKRNALDAWDRQLATIIENQKADVLPFVARG